MEEIGTDAWGSDVTQRDRPQPQLLAHLVAGNAARAWREPASGWLTYGDLADMVEALARRFPPGRQLVWLPFPTATPHLVAYLLGLRDGHAMMLADPGLAPALAAAEAARFGASVAIAEDGAPVALGAPPELHPSLALLLPTSGSTGRSKWVRLSAENLDANAAAIASYLELGPSDRAITSLPLFYAYGLSVLNSHLVVGASTVATTEGPLARAFWDLVDAEQVTGFAGVPFTWRTLARLSFDIARHPSLLTLTQAGGRLEPELVLRFARAARDHGRRFFVMYGQTEAAPRIAWLGTEDALEAPGAIGRAVPGGSLTLRPVPGAPDGEGELVYRGPNVMLGYADGAADLGRGAEVAELCTGDLARQDAAGRFHVTGRIGRFLKLAGRRVSLADVEAWLAERGCEGAAVGEDERLEVVFEAEPEGAREQAAALGRALTSWLRVPPAAVRVTALPSLPRGASLKVDYPRLRQLLSEAAR